MDEYSILWAIGGWDEEAQEVRLGGVCLDNASSPADALESLRIHDALTCRRVAKGALPPGELVCTDGTGTRVSMAELYQTAHQETAPFASVPTPQGDLGTIEADRVAAAMRAATAAA